jgi:hypothetical protein
MFGCWVVGNPFSYAFLIKEDEGVESPPAQARIPV